MKEDPRISILIGTHNHCEFLKKCLDSTVAQEYPKNLLELIILDDASTDNTALEIHQYLQNLKRQGFKEIYFFVMKRT